MRNSLNDKKKLQKLYLISNGSIVLIGFGFLLLFLKVFNLLFFIVFVTFFTALSLYFGEKLQNYICSTCNKRYFKTGQQSLLIKIKNIECVSCGKGQADK